VIELREQRDAIADERRQRAATERLQRVANQLGVRTATCADCGSSVDLAADRPPRPHCKSRFSDVVKRSSIFGSHRLETDEPPALEGHIEDPAGSTTDAVFEAIESEAESEMRNRDNGDGTDMTETDSGATDP